MANTILIKRSAVSAKVPVVADLQLGEIALNTYDGKLFVKKNNGADSIVEIGGVNSVAGREGDIVLTNDDVSGSAPLISPALTGSPTAPTAATSTNSTILATTAYVKAQLASPALTGSPTAPTAATTTNSTILATTAFVKAQGYATTSGSGALAPVQSVSGRTGDILLTSADVGLNLVENKTSTTIRSEITLANVTAALGYTPSKSSDQGVANGLATLDSTGKIVSTQLPSITITDTFVVASETAMLALTTQTGDVAVRTDLNKSFIVKGTDGSVIGNWQELLTPTDAVLSVAGRTGTVVLSNTDVSGSAPLASPTFTGTVVAPTPVSTSATTVVATTAFVKNQLYITSAGAPVQSVAGRSGDVVLTSADVTGSVTVNPTTPKTGDIKVVSGVISIYDTSAWKQVFPAVYA